jgi:metalloendopeptidase OMA1, mitochondrial
LKIRQCCCIFLAMKTIKFIILAVFVLASFSFSGCITIPETGKQALILTSPAYENQLGFDGYKEVISQSKISKDPGSNQILVRVGGRIAQATARSDYKWEFNLIESKEQNAWCMPGGKIAVYTGILPAMYNEAGMAAVMGHEVAHATLRHAGQRISQGLMVEMGLAITDITLGNTKHKNTILAMLGVGAAVGVVLPYSRSHESEADYIGAKYMARAGYDPREAVTFWQRFEKSAGGGAPPEFLSTHPGSSRRIADLQHNMPEFMGIYNVAPQKHGAGDLISFKASVN